MPIPESLNINLNPESLNLNPENQGRSRCARGLLRASNARRASGAGREAWWTTRTAPSTLPRDCTRAPTLQGGACCGPRRTQVPATLTYTRTPKHPTLDQHTKENLVIYCPTTSVSATHATHCATYFPPCQPLIQACTRETQALTRRTGKDIRLPGKGSSNSHGARPVY